MKKGITAASVVVLVLVITILLGTVTITSYNSIRNAEKMAFSLEISNIQEEVDDYIKDSEDGDYPISGNVYTLSLQDITTSVMSQFDGETKNSNNEITLYEIDMAAIKISDTQFGNKDSEKDVYVLSKETGKVYYLAGVKYEDTTYYTLTEELIDIDKRNEKMTSNNAVLIKPNITFDNELLVKEVPDGEKEIYLTNVQVSGDDIKVFKYEIGVIAENVAKSYFENNGKSVVNDRIRLLEETSVTLYAENSKGEYVVKYYVNN